jgi:hypothetical protein
MAKNRTVWVAVGVLVLVFVIGAVVAGGGKKKKTATSTPVSARAVVLPATRPRTVVIPPCSTPLSTTVRNAGAGRPTPGATTTLLPARSGVHTLLVPNCQPTNAGSTDAGGSIPSAAFVLGDRKRPTKDRDGKIVAGGVAAGSELLLPDASRASTVVVPPCTKKPSGNERDAVLGVAKGNSALAVARSC